MISLQVRRNAAFAPLYDTGLVPLENFAIPTPGM